jgi:hypothetical protein
MSQPQALFELLKERLRDRLGIDEALLLSILTSQQQDPNSFILGVLLGENLRPGTSRTTNDALLLALLLAGQSKQSGQSQPSPCAPGAAPPPAQNNLLPLLLLLDGDHGERRGAQLDSNNLLFLLALAGGLPARNNLLSVLLLLALGKQEPPVVGFGPAVTT